MGYGDWIMSICDAKLAKLQNPDAQIVFGTKGKTPYWDEVFENIPYITHPKKIDLKKKLSIFQIILDTGHIM